MKKEIGSIFTSLLGAVLFFAIAWQILGLGWIVSVILAAGVYGGLTLFTKPKRQLGGIDVEEIPGGQALEQKLAEARADFKSIGSSMESIEDPQMKLESRRLHETAGRILKYLEDHPEKIMTARRFIDYYQDTASKLLEKYVRLQKTGLSTKEADRLKGQTKQALLVLNRAFAGQFEKLMQNELMDMDADIRLLKQTMKAEGYEEDD